MSIDWLNDNSRNSGDGEDRPAVYFQDIGDKIIGTIIGTPRQVDTKYGQRLIIELRAVDGSTATKGNFGQDGAISAGDEVALWVKPGAMASAIREALADVKGISEGDTLAVAYSEAVDTGKPSPLKKYQARYTPAKPAVTVESLV
jgi:hypothetical protein